MIAAFIRKTAVLVLAGVSTAFAQPPLPGLNKLDPQTRLEQVCDMEAMTRIKKESKFRPDRAKSYARSMPRTKGDTIIANGAAFRSQGKWYEFSFTCKVSPDHMQVLDFKYQIGESVPPSKWEEYGLWQ